MKFVIDTSAYSHFNRGDARLRSYITNQNAIVFPLIVIGELRAEFLAGSKKSENKVLLDRVLSKPNNEIATLSQITANLFAELYQDLKKAGTPIGSNDIWIAALALEFDLPLLTLDNGFKNISKLKLIDL